MNTRRGFFKKCALFVAGCAFAVKASQAEELDPIRIKSFTGEMKLNDFIPVIYKRKKNEINPEWVNAPYQMVVMKPNGEIVSDPLASRYTSDGRMVLP